jgi:UDP:flavonoid glycosyltransferase YjiC (YdhE family)
MSADNYYVLTDHPTLGLIAFKAYMSDVRPLEQLAVEAVAKGWYVTFASDQEADEFFESHPTEYGEYTMYWPK